MVKEYWGLAVLSGALAVAACGTSGGTGSSVRPSGSGGGQALGSGGNGSVSLNTNPDPTSDSDPGNPNITHPTCAAGACLDFPAGPIMGDGVPANAATLFGDPTNFTAGGLCALEPQLSAGSTPGAMIPANWVRPRFRVAAPAGIDVLEIRIHSAAEKNDLVAYTSYKPAANGAAPSWYLPKAIWTGTTTAASPASGAGLANNAAGTPLTVTIRGVNSASPGKPVGVQGDFNIAPVVATGSMVFWTVNSGNVTPDSSKLLGFAVGDEGVASALTLPQVAWSGEIGEDGAVLRGFYDMPKLPGFVDGQVRCIGCHATIPDGTGVIFGDDWPWSLASASLASATLTVGALPTGISAGAQAIMKTPWWGQTSMSKAHWVAGDKTIVTSYGTTFNTQANTTRTIPWQALPCYKSSGNCATDQKIKWHSLAWINAEYAASIPVAIPVGNAYGTMDLATRQAAVTASSGTGWGLIATGDSNISDVSPNISHDGKSIVYVTTDYSPDGHPDATATVADIHTLPYSRAGGTATPLAGASDPGKLEYYPSYSADDKLIAFTQAPAKSAAAPDGPYYNRFGKVMVIPPAGGTATELVANDPGTCGGDNLATGIINSWPKWSPDAVVSADKTKTYYFLVFSSARKYADEFSKQFTLTTNTASSFTGLGNSSQLYLAAVVVDNATGAITSYPAVYIWNQNRTPGTDGTTSAGLQYSNLTPAWDPIALPPLMIPDVPSDVR